MKHRYVVTSAYRTILSSKLRYMGSATSQESANRLAAAIHNSGGRALVHDTTGGKVARME